MTETTISTPASNAGSTESAEAPVAGGAKRRAAGLAGMLLPELKQMAGGLGIKGAGGMRKSQLIDAIKAAQSGGQSGNQSGNQSRQPVRPTRGKAAPEAKASGEAPAESRGERRQDRNDDRGNDRDARQRRGNRSDNRGGDDQQGRSDSRADNRNDNRDRGNNEGGNRNNDRNDNRGDNRNDNRNDSRDRSQGGGTQGGGTQGGGTQGGQHADRLHAIGRRATDPAAPEAVESRAATVGDHLERTREQVVRPGGEHVRHEAGLVDDPEPDEHREEEGVRQERRNLGAPHGARHDHEDRDVGDQQRQLLQGQHELAGLVEVAGGEHHADERAREVHADREMHAREAQPRRGAAARR